MSVSIVAKKKSKIGRPKLPDTITRVSAFGIRSSLEWREWVIGLAEHERINLSDLVDRALVDYARKVGYEPPPPKR